MTAMTEAGLTLSRGTRAITLQLTQLVVLVAYLIRNSRFFGKKFFQESELGEPEVEVAPM